MLLFLNPNRVARISLLIVSMFLLSLIVGGCASQYGAQTVVVKHYAQCYKPIGDLRKDETELAQSTAMGALIGGLAGGLTGFAATGDAKGAAIGGLAGAIIGGTASYLITADLQQKSKAERFAAYSAALDADLKSLGLAVAAAKVTSNCYEKEYKKLDRLYNSGQINKQEMVERLTELRAGTDDTNAILAKFSAKMADNQLVYNDIKKREVARKTGGLSKNEMKNLDRKTNRLQAADTEAQATARILTNRTKIYANRLKALTSTAWDKTPQIQMAAATTTCLL